MARDYKRACFKTNREWITSESEIKGVAFAVQITSTDYLPEFRKGTLITIDCARVPKEGDFVLALLKKTHQAILAQFSVEKDHNMLLPLAQTGKELPINANVKICGIIAEAKHSF